MREAMRNRRTRRPTKRYADQMSSSRERTSLEELVDAAVESAKNYNSLGDAEDYREEAVDGALPVYYAQMVDLMRDTDLMYYPVGEIFAPGGTLVDAITATLYDIISEGLYARWDEVVEYYAGEDR